MAAALPVFLVVALAVARRGETDQADVAAAARGDQQALGRLYDRYGRLVTCRLSSDHRLLENSASRHG